MVKNKQNAKNYFWLMLFFFGFMTVTGLLLLWADPPPMSGHTTMMGSTMGDAARKEVVPVKLSDLFKAGEFVKSNTSGHHQGGSLTAKIHFATTVTIAAVLPVIVGGLALLLVLWL